MLTAATRSRSRTVESETPAIEVAGVAKRYARSWALRGVDLEIGRGERVIVLGENGSGKSTLLRLLATTARPSRGTLRVLDADVHERSEWIRERITFLPDRPAFYGALTPFENVDFVCAMHGRRVPPLAIRAALQSLGLGDVADEPAHSLSRGMTQRMALAAALLRPAEIVLLDEPYTALDSSGIAWVDQWLEQLRASGATVIVATHLVTPRARAGARVATLREGKLEEGMARASYPRDPRSSAHANAAAHAAPGGGWGRAWLVAQKDLRIERRGGAAFAAMICFAAVVLLLFGFALGPGGALREAASGLLWVTVLLASVLALDRAAQHESEHGGWDAYRAMAGERWPIYAGKVMAASLLLSLVELALLPCAIVLYDLAVPSLSVWLELALLAALATVGIVAVGMLYAVLTANIRARQLLLPLLLFPIMIPVLLAAVKSTGLLLEGDPMHELAAWIKLLAAADLIYVTVGVCAFGALLDE